MTLLALAATSPTAAQFTAGEQAQLVGGHNAVRADVEPIAMPMLPNLTWGVALATTAQTHANQCVFQHSLIPGIGENLYASTGDTNPRPSPVDVVVAWASEDGSYTYSTNTCTGVCGHYTQMVRRPATQVGCGIQECPASTNPFAPPFDTFDWYLVVCQYNAGQSGGRPYLCDYDGNGSVNDLCTDAFFADGFEETQLLPGNWGGKAP